MKIFDLTARRGKLTQLHRFAYATRFFRVTLWIWTWKSKPITDIVDNQRLETPANASKEEDLFVSTRRNYSPRALHTARRGERGKYTTHRKSRSRVFVVMSRFLVKHTQRGKRIGSPIASTRTWQAVRKYY